MSANDNKFFKFHFTRILLMRVAIISLTLITKSIYSDININIKILIYMFASSAMLCIKV